jgi:high-affinity nickel permease
VNRTRYDWAEYALPGRLCYYAVCATAWAAISATWGACVVLGLIAFGLALIAIAWEGVQR